MFPSLARAPSRVKLRRLSRESVTCVHSAVHAGSKCSGHLRVFGHLITVRSYYMVTGVLHALCNGRHLWELKARRLVCKDAMKSTPENSPASDKSTGPCRWIARVLDNAITLAPLLLPLPWKKDVDGDPEICRCQNARPARPVQ